MKILIKICSIITACLLLQSCSGGDKSSNASKEKFNVELVQESLSIGSTVKNIITFKDKIYFIDKTETELWVSDGTSEGTFIFLDSSFTNEDIRVLIKADDFFISRQTVSTSAINSGRVMELLKTPSSLVPFAVFQLLT